MTSVTISQQQPEHWRCLAKPNGKLCGKVFHDPSNTAPCPACGNTDDNLMEPTNIEVHPAQPKQQPAPQPKQQPQPAQAPVAPPAGVMRVMPTGRALGLVAIGVGAPLWIEGARAIRDGIIVAINWLMERVGMPFDIPRANAWSWWFALAVMVALGVLFRVVEINYVPFRMPPRWTQFFRFRLWKFSPIWEHWLVWLVLIVIDVLMVYVGVRADPPPLTITQQIAASGQLSSIYAIIVTFLPDRLIQWGWRRLFPRNK